MNLAMVFLIIGLTLLAVVAALYLIFDKLYYTYHGDLPELTKKILMGIIAITGSILAVALLLSLL